MNRSRILSLFMSLALWSAAMTAGAAEKGWFGFAISVDAAGLLSPTLRSITIEKVFAASPAALAGLASGDAVVEVQGIVVAGAKAEVLRAALQKSVGETLRLRVRRGVGETREVSLVAASKPPGV
jgi:S1-C subfamily serine protease